MNMIKLDGELINEYSHEYLIKKLDLPSYYGRNLDALYDCLTSIGIKTEIHLKNSDKISKALLDTFVDSASTNDYLSFKVIEDSY